MKGNIFATTAVLAMLIGLSQVAMAECGTHSFTPVDELPPEARQQVNAKLAELLKNMQVDWDNIVAGVNENGEITLRAKSETTMKPMSSYSCYGDKAQTCDETK